MLKTLSYTVLITLLTALFATFAAAEVGPVTGLPMPRFVALKSNETNLRKGPNVKYPISWNYKLKGYPMEVVAEFENWRKLRDHDGAEGWVHENLITGSRSVYIKSNSYLNKPGDYPIVENELILFRYPDENSYPMIRAEVGVVAKLKSCNLEWCKVRLDDVSGWVRKANLWGVYENEEIK